jgi:hypothetical protein
LSRQAGGAPADWANESFQEAKKVWLDDGGAVDEVYYRANISIVDHRLALAGLRLAKALNESFGGKQPLSREPLIQHEVNHHAGN